MNTTPFAAETNRLAPPTGAGVPTLFGAPEAGSGSSAVYADVVFDRPLDQAYTYAVPEELAAAVAVGKRVEAPFGKGDKPTEGYCVRVTTTPPPRAVKPILRVLDGEALLSDALLRLTRWMADYYLCGWGQVLHAVVPAGAREQAGLRDAVMLEPVPDAELPSPRPPLTDKQLAALDLLRRLGRRVEQRELTRLARSGPGPVFEIVRKGFARATVERVEKFDLNDLEPGEAAAPITLNPDQQRVWTPLEAQLKAGGYRAFLLHGVTGSGKTEVYLRAIEEVTRRGQQAIVLVPEISLTPQTIERFRGRCGNVAVLHSHLTDAERGGHWRRVAAGQVSVVVGARSAVFAPTRNLGLIVIDEEHENSFKQEATPRYHARDVAVMRARLENVPVVMGSATPSLESWHNAQAGNYALLSLPSRVLDRPMPRVELVDLRHEPKPKNRFHAISPTLEAAMRAALDAKGQVILLLNRRGFSTHVHCPGCGHVVSCRHCDLSMTFHRSRQGLLCHHCGFESPPAETCPACKKAQLRYQGYGTEKLHEELREKFADKVVQRMDSDTMAQPGSHARVLDAFRNGLIHILVGTQMIAKGLDFPNVTLVGVVNADVGLHLPDFRSAERTFQLLAQVAGRAGRGEAGGKVLVQTFNPEHPCIALASAHDYVGFVERELEFRRLHGYPPYQRMARLIVRSERQEAAAGFADQLAGAFAQAVQRVSTASPKAAVRLLGPAEAPVFRLNNYYRFHFQLQSDSPLVLHRVLRQTLGTARPPHGVEYQLDVDPFNML